MPVTVHWLLGEVPHYSDRRTFATQVKLMNAQNFVERRCVIGKIVIKPGVVPAHYKRLRDEALEKVGRSLGFYGPSFYND